MPFLHTVFLASFMSSICPPVPKSRTRHITKVHLFVYVCACRCPAVSQTPYGPLYLISPICYQDRYCLHRGGEVSPSLCLSVTLSLSLSHLVYTQTACTDVPLSQNPEWPLHRHLSERGVSGIIHSAGTDYGEGQGQLWLLCQGKPSRAIGVTSFSSLILHQ